MLLPERTATILVVEDDEALRETYRTALIVAGFAVIAVEDGFDALRRLEAGIPDAVVLDLALPRLPGRDVYRELASRPDTRNIPVVVVTGEELRDVPDDAFACVLRKPVDPEALVTAIESCLRRRGGRIR